MSEFRPDEGADHLTDHDLERASLIENLLGPEEIDDYYDPPCLPDEHMPREVHLVAKVCDRCGTITEQAVVIST